MKTSLKLAGILWIYLLLASCGSAWYLKSTNIEVLVPAKVIFPDGYSNLAIRYNNSNVSFNPHFAEYLVADKIVADTTNIDSVSSEIYYKSFSERIKNNLLFETISEIQRGNYSKIWLSDSLVHRKYPLNEDSIHSGIPLAVSHFVALTTKFQPEQKNKTITKFIDPAFGLYSLKDLSDIADSTGADMLLSLDYFAVLDAQVKALSTDVYVVTSWNFYDLNKSILPYFYNRVDTFSWRLTDGQLKIPPRKDALLMASEISGAQFADFLVPNWIEVERVYYRPWIKELKVTRELVSEGEWKKAAGYWRIYTNDKNKRTAARSMYNMALAAEMENQTDAAIDWLVRSYHLLEKRDPVHKEICENYLQVLTQRKLDIKQINVQFTRDLYGTK